MYSGACFVIWKKEFLPNFDRKIKKSFRVYLTQAEGRILGTGANMFKVAGPVIVYGSAAAAVYGVIYYIAQKIAG